MHFCNDEYMAIVAFLEQLPFLRVYANKLAVFLRVWWCKHVHNHEHKD